MTESGCPAVVLTLTPDKKFTANDIGSILHRQKGGRFDLFIISCGQAQKIPESLKKMAKSVYLSMPESIGKPLNHIVSKTQNSVYAFLTDRVKPTHDHWLKRICEPVLNGTASAAFGREIPTPDGNYFLIKEIEKSFPLKGDVASRRLFSINNCAIARQPLTQSGFPESGAFEPAIVWMIKSGVLAAYQPEAIVMRPADASLKEIYTQNRRIGADNAACGGKSAFFDTVSKIAADTARDLRYCLSMKKPQHLWYPFLYRSAMHFGYYLGQRGSEDKDEKG